MPKYSKNISPKFNLISVTKAADFLGVSPDTLRNWEKVGKLIPQRTAGGARRYDLESLKPFRKQLTLPRKPMGLLSISKAAHALNVSKDTLRNWEKRGLIAPQRTAGGTRRYSKTEIKRLQEKRTIQAPPQAPVALLAAPEVTRRPNWFSNIPNGIYALFIVLALLSGLLFFNNSSNQTKDNQLEQKVYGLATNLEYLQNTLNKLQKSPLNIGNILGINEPSSQYLDVNIDARLNGSLAVGSDATVSGTLKVSSLGAGIVQSNESGVLSSSALNLASNQVTGTLPAGKGGTGVATTPSNGQVLIGTGTGFALANLTAGSGISVTNSAGGITITNTNSSTTLPQSLGTGDSPKFAGLTLTNGTTNGVLYFDSSQAVQSVVGGAGTLCLQEINGAAPTFGSCASGVVSSLDSLTGALTISNSSGSGSTITINNSAADGSTKGIAAFNATNFSASSGVINTIQNISTSSSPSFAGLTLSSLSSNSGTSLCINGTTIVTCTAGSSASTLQSAYNNGNTITTTTGSNIAFTLAAGLGTSTQFSVTNNHASNTTDVYFDNNNASGTNTNGLLIEQTGAGTLTNGLQIKQTSGTLTNGLTFSGTFTNLINSPNFTVANSGAIASTPSSDTTALTLTGNNVASSNLLYLNAKNSSGTVVNLAYGASQTLSGALIGENIDLDSGQITNSNNDITGLKVILPTVTDSNAAGTVNIKGLSFGFGSGSGINQTGAGSTVYSGVDISLPALTQTSGTLTGNGININTPSQITTGGTGNGINIAASGVGAGSLNGLNISSITGAAGTETALNIGSGWDNVLKVNGTAIINGSGITQVAGGGTGLSTYTAGDLIYSDSSNHLTQLAVGSSGQVLKVSGGVPSWGTITGSACTDCLISDPSSSASNTIAPTGASTTGLIVKQTSTASPTNDIFDITNKDGTVVYFSVDKNGNVNPSNTIGTTLTITPTTDTTALTLVGTNVATQPLQYINAKNSSTVSGIINLAYGASQTLTGSVTGINEDLSTNVTATNQSVTGQAITLPSVTNTNTSGTKNLIGLSISDGGGLNTTGVGGTTTLSEIAATLPALTQTAGTLNGNGVLVTTPSSITTGGTANALNVSASGVGAGTLNGLNISTITGGAGTENAITIGSGWDKQINANGFTLDGSGNITQIGGAAHTIQNSSGALAIDAAGSGALNLNGTGTGDVNIAGGSGSTGCTVTNSNGNLNCTGNITAGSTGTVGYWTRSGSTISPATSTDLVNLTPNVSTGTGTSAGLYLAANSLTTGNGIDFQSSSLTTGNLLNLSSTSTAGNGEAALNIAISGANGTSSKTNYGLKSAVTNTGTSSTNIAGYFSASGGSNNYAIIVPSTGGNVGIGTTTPAFALDVNGEGNFGGIQTSDGFAAASATTFFQSSASNVYGGIFQSYDQNPNDSSITNLYGQFNKLYYEGKPTTLSNGIGLLAGIYTQSVVQANSFFGGSAKGTITNSYGVLVDNLSNIGSDGNTNVTITNSYGAYLGNASSAGGLGVSVTNAYGLYIASQSGASTLNYALYSAGGTNYFGGNVGIGDSSPASLLTVGNGDLFQVDSTGKIAASVGINSAGGAISFNPSLTKASATSLVWDGLLFGAGTSTGSTLTLTGTTHVTTAAGLNLLNIPAPTITDSSVVTVDNASSVYISGAPSAGGSVTLTNPYALNVASGMAYFGGTIRAEGPVSETATGNSRLDIGVQSGTPRIVMETTPGGSAEWEIDNSAGKLRIYNPGEEQVNITPNGSGSSEYSTLALVKNFTDIVNISAGANSFFNGGNVGIGTSSPGSPLTVAPTTTFTTGTISQVTAPAATLTGAFTGLNVNVSGTTPGTNSVTGISTTAFTGGGDGSTNVGVNIGNVKGSGTSSNYALQIGTASGGATNIGLYNASTAELVGNVGIGVAPASDQGLLVLSSTTTSTIQRGILSQPTFSSAATGNSDAIAAQAITAASAFTATEVNAFHAFDPGKGTGSSITSNVGLLVDSMTKGTTNYGIFINAPSGGSTNIGLDNAGTTVLAGNVGVGSGSLLTNLDVVGQVTDSEVNPHSANNYTQLFIQDSDNADSGLKLGYRYQGGVAEYGRIQASNSVGATNLVINPEGGNVGIGTSSPGAKFVVNATCTSFQTTHQCTDYAEIYPASENTDYGDVISIDQNVSPDPIVRRSSSQYDSKVLGIVSTHPAVVVDGDNVNLMQGSDYQIDPKKPAIALSGRVPTKVSTENGPIQVGDYLTSSSVPGVAMKAARPGPTVGKALESYSAGGVGKILVFVNVSYADPNNALANLNFDSDGTLIVPKLRTATLMLDPTVITAEQPSNTGSIDPSKLLASGTPASSENAQPSQPSPIEVASKLQTIDSSIASQSAQLADINSKVASQSSAIAQAQNDISKLKLTPPDALMATGSATLAKINVSDTISTLNLNSIDATVSGTFKALGDSFLGNTTVAGDISINGTFSIGMADDGDTLNSLPNLHIQSSPLAQLVDFFNGLVSIDKTGTVTAQNIKAQSVQVAGFKVVSNKISGSGTILSGTKSIDIENSLVSQNSRILITPTSNTGMVLAVTQKVNGQKFTVSAPNNAPQNITFDYFIIQEVNPSPTP